MKYLPKWFLVLMLERCYWKVTTLFIKGSISMDKPPNQYERDLHHWIEMLEGELYTRRKKKYERVDHDNMYDSVLCNSFNVRDIYDRPDTEGSKLQGGGYDGQL